MHLIPGLKCDLSGRHFAMEADLQRAVVEFFAKQDAEWYGTDIRKLILRYNNCLDKQGSRKAGNFARNPINVTTAAETCLSTQN